MHRRPSFLVLAALLLAACGLASAQDAFTARPMNVRAGPNSDYPLVAQLDAGVPLDVHGCLSDWSWCDASFDGGRGWIYAGGLSFVYEGERVPLYSYGPHLGLPIITFSLSTYWGDYYRGRPWYRDRDEWEHRRMPPHRRPPGRPYAGPPPMGHRERPPTYNRPEISRGRPGAERGRPPESRGRPPLSNEHPRRPNERPPMSHTRPAPSERPVPRPEERGHARPPEGARAPQPHRQGPPARGRPENHGADHRESRDKGRPPGI